MLEFSSHRIFVAGALTKRRMKYRLSFLLALTSSLSSFVESQTPSSKFNATFTWIAGSNMTGAPTIYGTPGLASFSADPGGRYGACSAIAYSGPDTLYVYGGILSSTGPTGIFCYY